MRLHLLGGFELRLGSQLLHLPMAAQRLVSFLAVHERPLLRSYVAGSLWIDSSEGHSAGCLRSALWRLSRPGLSIIECHSKQLAVHPDVEVDFRHTTQTARRLVAGACDPQDGDLAAMAFAGELLPDWYDDWLLVERERFHQLRIDALEVLAWQLCADGRYAQAAEAGLAAVDCEPMRESSHRAVVRAYLLNGNVAEALRQYYLYKRLLQKELGLTPSTAMEQLVGPFLGVDPH